ncbi:reverse transcriptase domain-containing protein [Tanacetum coccineum]
MSRTVNVEPNVSMHLGTKSGTTNISKPTTLRKSTISNTPSSSNSFVALAFWKSTRDLKGNDLLTGSRGTDLYSITLQDTSTPNPISLMAKATSSQAWLRHHRLSHLNFDTINLLSKYDIVTGLPKLKFVKDHLCSSCELRKAKRLGIPIYPKKKTKEGMVDSQPIEEEIQGAKARDVGTETRMGPTEPVLQTQKALSLSLAFIKENIDMLRTMIKEHDQQAKTKATPRRVAYADSGEEFQPEDPFQEQGTVTPKKVKKVKRPKHNQRENKKGKVQIQREKRAKLPNNIRVYKGNKDLKDHLSIFLAAAKQEKWSIPIWCKMFHQTLGGAAQKWFDDLDPKTVDSFEELSQKFLEEFSQQKRYVNDLTEIHDIKRRQNEGLQAFMDWFKYESSHIKGVPLVLRISAFMHGHGHSELAKKLNDKIPKTIDEIFKRVRAFIKGEVMAGSGEMVRPSQWDKGDVCPAWSRGPKKARNRGGPRETQRNIGIYTPYPRKDTFTLLIKTQRRSWPWKVSGLREVGSPGEGHPPEEPEERESRKKQRKIHKHDNRGGNCKRPFEGESSGLTDELTFLAIPQNRLMDEPIILERRIEDHQV